MLSLDKSHPKAIALKQKIAKYVASAEIVFEALKVKKKPAKAVTGLTAGVGVAFAKITGEVKVNKKPLVFTGATELPTELPRAWRTRVIFLWEAPSCLTDAPWRRSGRPLVLTEAATSQENR